MEHKVINQTQLVHDIISLRNDFEVASPTNQAQAECGGYDVELYNWYLIDQASGSEALVGKWGDQTWEGVLAA